MKLATTWVAIAAFAVTALLAGLVRRLALAWGVLDIPNDRSSHQRVTPRGGGIAIVATFTLGMLVLALGGRLSHELLWALLPGGLGVAVVGFLDDRGRVSAGMRLAVHVLAAVWAVSWLGGLPSVRLGDHVTYLRPVTGAVLAVLGIGWTLNLFNFMDGIDGIASAEALCVAGAGAVLAAAAGNSGVAAAAGVLAFSCAGFLGWNWSPARIFLGDVGSGYLGYVIAVLALADSAHRPAAVWVWLILGGVFFVDASVTLVRRALRGERLHEAHRQHAYQRAALRWGSHAKVTVAVVIVNLLWLFPWAVFALHHPDSALLVVGVSLLPLLLVVAGLGAGRPTRAP